MATKSSVGWLILGFSLAIPAVLFVQWHARIDQVQKQADDAKVRLKPKSFPVSAEKDHLVNPIVEAPVPQPVVPAPALIQASPAAPAPAAAKGGLAEGLAALPVPDMPPAPEVKGFGEWRDPTLSPYDIVRIEESKIAIGLAKAEAQEQAEKARQPRARPKPSPEKSIDLQGIIYIDAGNHSAIVNGDNVREGQTVKTKAGLVKVLSISPQQVWFSHQGRRFSKSVNR